MNERDTVEQPSKGSFLQKFIKLTPDRSFTTGNEVESTFESQLFCSGTLDFNLDQYVAAASLDLRRQKDWYDNNPHWDAKRTAESVTRDLDGAKYEMIWRNRFSGQIPRQWHNWCNISDDFEEARNLGVKLTETLVDAGVSHPHHYVANEVGKGQRLNVKQLAWLFARPDFPTWNRDEILVAQRNMGVKEGEIREAMRTADQVREDMKKSRHGSYALEDMPDEF